MYAVGCLCVADNQLDNKKIRLNHDSLCKILPLEDAKPLTISHGETNLLKLPFQIGKVLSVRYDKCGLFFVGKIHHSFISWLEKIKNMYLSLLNWEDEGLVTQNFIGKLYPFVSLSSLKLPSEESSRNMIVKSPNFINHVCLTFMPARRYTSVLYSSNLQNILQTLLKAYHKSKETSWNLLYDYMISDTIRLEKHYFFEQPIHINKELLLADLIRRDRISNLKEKVKTEFDTFGLDSSFINATKMDMIPHDSNSPTINMFTMTDSQFKQFLSNNNRNNNQQHAMKSTDMDYQVKNSGQNSDAIDSIIHKAIKRYSDMQTGEPVAKRCKSCSISEDSSHSQMKKMLSLLSSVNNKPQNQDTEKTSDLSNNISDLSKSVNKMAELVQTNYSIFENKLESMNKLLNNNLNPTTMNEKNENQLPQTEETQNCTQSSIDLIKQSVVDNVTKSYK